MAGSVNKVILIGNLGQDPETRSFPNGGKVVNLRIATNETWTDRNSGEKRERVEWHTVAIFNENLQNIATQYLKKGSQVFIEGKLETRKWQGQGGEDRYSTEVVLRQFNGDLTLLGGAPGGQSQDQDRRSGNSQQQDRSQPQNSGRHTQGYDDRYDNGGPDSHSRNGRGNGYGGNNGRSQQPAYAPSVL